MWQFIEIVEGTDFPASHGDKTPETRPGAARFHHHRYSYGSDDDAFDRFRRGKPKYSIVLE